MNKSIKYLYDFAKRELPDEHEALIFFEELFSLNRQDIILNADKLISNPEILFSAIDRRKKGEPLQYILGYWYFADLKLKVEDGVLIPREDTLVLTDIAEKFIGDNSFLGVDLCSGTGAVALKVASFCGNVKIDALELYEVPFNCLTANIASLKIDRVKAVRADVFTAYNDYSELDFILSNPPYINTEEISSLQSEVQREPKEALDGGLDGLVFYRFICSKWSISLKIGGLLAVEIGDTQADEVTQLFEENNFTNIRVLSDFNSLPRVVCGIRDK